MLTWKSATATGCPTGGASHFHLCWWRGDVVLFLCPTGNDLIINRDLLEVFGYVSGLRTNMIKSLVSPVQCSKEDMALTTEVLACATSKFRCAYLGLPLTINKPTKADLLPLIDKIADNLPGWKASLTNKASQLFMVKVVLPAIPISEWKQSGTVGNGREKDLTTFIFHTFTWEWEWNRENSIRTTESNIWDIGSEANQSEAYL